MNTYTKYCPNVWVAKCPEKHEKGEVIPVTTQHGKENECIVFNQVLEREGFFYYSIVRADGYNVQERAKAKAERYKKWAASAESKSNQYYNASNKDSDFLSLGEPIKIGHHSEGRHRRIIEQAQKNMSKCVELSDKAESHEGKAEYWERKTNTINLSMPESVEYFEYKVEKCREYHEGVKSGKYPRSHSFTLTYAKKDLNEAEKNLQTAKKLWS